MSDLTHRQIAQLAQLAHVNLTDEEVHRVAVELKGILNSVRQVQEIAGPDVPITTPPVLVENVLRDDVVRGVLAQEAALASAPAVENSQFHIPAILPGEDA